MSLRPFATEAAALMKRCKVARPLLNAHEALAAWKLYHRYHDVAQAAFVRYLDASPGTATQRRHNTARTVYSEVAAGWKQALERWLVRETKSGWNRIEPALEDLFQPRSLHVRKINT